MKIKEFISQQRFYLGILLLVILFNLFVFGSNTEEEIASNQLPRISKRLDWKAESIMQALQKKPYLTHIFNLLALGGMLALLAGVVMNIRYILLKLKNKEILKSCFDLEQPRWGIWDVCKVAILFLFFSQIIYGIEQLFFHLDIYLRMVINTYILDVAVVVLVIFIVTTRYRQNLSSLGLTLKSWLKGIMIGVVGYVTLLPILFLIALVVFTLARGLDYQPPPQAVFELFLMEERKGILILSTILVAVLGPVGEEIFFRGFMYRAIRNRFGVRIGLILSAALFAGLHNNLIGFFPIMALGMLLAYLYEKSGSLIPSITVHIIHNSLIVLFVFLVREIVKLL